MNMFFFTVCYFLRHRPYFKIYFFWSICNCIFDHVWGRIFLPIKKRKMKFRCGHPTKKNTPCCKKVPFRDMKCHLHRQNCGTCCICLSEITSEENLSLKCHHNFHKGCINNWLKHQLSCPHCRAPVTDKKTLTWFDEYNLKDEEWLPEENDATPVNRRQHHLLRVRRLRRRNAARRSRRQRTLMEQFFLLIGSIGE